MATHNIIVVNLTGAPLYVTGSYGSDLSGMTEGQQIATGTSATVAQWNAGNSVQDNWDFIFFGRQGGELDYQIYMEKTAVSQNLYQFMGFYSASHNNQNSNPNPFKNGSCSVTGRTANDDWVYTFLTSPS